MGYNPWGCKESNMTECARAGVPRSRDKDYIFEQKMLLALLSFKKLQVLEPYVRNCG